MTTEAQLSALAAGRAIRSANLAARRAAPSAEPTSPPSAPAPPRPSARRTDALPRVEVPGAPKPRRAATAAPKPGAPPETTGPEPERHRAEPGRAGAVARSFLTGLAGRRA